MEINVSQVDKNLANAGSGQTVVAKENLTNGVLPEKRQNTQEISKTVEKEDSTEKVLSSREIAAAVEGLSDFAKTTNRQLNFSIDEGTDKQVVKVTDAESGKVIRQIPSEEILRLSERLRELQSDLGATVGILFNKQV